MTVSMMRDYILKAYNYAPKWKKKVDKMSDGQILAVYHRLLYSGKLS